MQYEWEREREKMQELPWKVVRTSDKMPILVFLSRSYGSSLSVYYFSVIQFLSPIFCVVTNTSGIDILGRQIHLYDFKEGHYSYKSYFYVPVSQREIKKLFKLDFKILAWECIILTTQA
jgi:hypothetical protein